jgi:hypothetical protein
VIRSSINTFAEGFTELTEKLEARIVEGLDAASLDAAAVAQSGASIDLEIAAVKAHGTEDGYASGIRAMKKGKRGTAIAGFFDAGTLGKRRKKPKRPGRSSWTVKRGGGSYTAHRGDITDKGIPPERFFAKARTAGRAKLREVIHRT